MTFSRARATRAGMYLRSRYIPSVYLISSSLLFSYLVRFLSARLSDPCRTCVRKLSVLKRTKSGHATNPCAVLLLCAAGRPRVSSRSRRCVPRISARRRRVARPNPASRHRQARSRICRTLQARSHRRPSCTATFRRCCVRLQSTTALPARRQPAPSESAIAQQWRVRADRCANSFGPLSTRGPHSARSNDAHRASRRIKAHRVVRAFPQQQQRAQGFGVDA